MVHPFTLIAREALRAPRARCAQFQWEDGERVRRLVVMRWAQACQRKAFNEVFTHETGDAWGAFWRWHASVLREEDPPVPLAQVVAEAIGAGEITVRPPFQHLPPRVLFGRIFTS